MKKDYVIYFESKTQEENKGYYQKMQKVGFLSTKYKEQAKLFKSKKAVENKINSLIEKEGKWYKFEIREITYITGKQAMAYINILSHSQGTYGRILADLEGNKENRKAFFKEVEKAKIRNTENAMVDFVMWLEG